MEDGIPFEIANLKRRPDLAEEFGRMSQGAWPPFLLHADTLYWDSLFDEFAGFQFAFLDPEGAVIATGHTVPFIWDGTEDDLPLKLSEALGRGLEAHRQGHAPDTLSALAAIVAPDHQRKGLSTRIIRTMRSLAVDHGMHSLLAPVRPTLKSLYPLTPFERYVEWKREDGTPFDPWLRVHHRLGAQFMKVAPQAITVTGSVTEWEEWTGVRFPESGEYVVPGALQSVHIDRDCDEGRCDDPNVWMRHPVP
ncbi:MAG: GNAT family N-acetyltransferase [Rubrobacteraceae bacterium]